MEARSGVAYPREIVLLVSSGVQRPGTIAQLSRKVRQWMAVLVLPKRQAQQEFLCASDAAITDRSH
jgi:hypothetical protein